MQTFSILLIEYTVCVAVRYFSTWFYVASADPSPIVVVSPSGPIQGAMVGSPQMIQCIANTTTELDVNFVMFTWIRPGGDTITSDSRVTINPTTSSGSTYTSSIQFTYLMEGDEGTYMCNVTTFSITGSASVELEPLNGK